MDSIDRLKISNPFYSNHVFSDLDLKRVRIKWWEYPLLWFRPTYVQISGDHVFYFKRDGSGRYYLMDVKGFKP